MPAAILLFFGGTAEKVGAFLLKCLAVCGAFVVGYLIGGILAWALDRYAFANKSPEFLKKGVRLATGLIAAILAAMLLFKDGGGDGEGSGGGGAGSGGGSSPVSLPVPSTQPSQPKEEPPPPKKVEPPATKIDVVPPEVVQAPKDAAGRVVVRVTFLGPKNNVTQLRAYVLNDDKQNPVNFDDLKAAVSKLRTDAGSAGVVLVLGRSGPERIARSHITVTAVEAWAREQKIGFSWPEDTTPQK